jgi:hypothetical protein
MLRWRRLPPEARGVTRGKQPAPRRFVRVYYDDLEADYGQTCWFAPTGLSTYVRLLAGADKAWPSLPELPRSVRRADLAALVTSGLVTLEPNDHYSVKGYAKERAERQVNAKKAAGARWGTDADAVA